MPQRTSPPPRRPPPRLIMGSCPPMARHHGRLTVTGGVCGGRRPSGHAAGGDGQVWVVAHEPVQEWHLKWRGGKSAPGRRGCGERPGRWPVVVKCGRPALRSPDRGNRMPLNGLLGVMPLVGTACLCLSVGGGGVEGGKRRVPVGG